MVKILHRARKFDNRHAMNHLGLIIKTFCLLQIYIFFWRHTRFKTWMHVCACYSQESCSSWTSSHLNTLCDVTSLGNSSCTHTHTHLLCSFPRLLHSSSQVFGNLRGGMHFLSSHCCAGSCVHLLFNCSGPPWDWRRLGENSSSKHTTMWCRIKTLQQRAEDLCRTSACLFSCVKLVWW